jgi:hypothetical protein
MKMLFASHFAIGYGRYLSAYQRDTDQRVREKCIGIYLAMWLKKNHFRNYINVSACFHCFFFSPAGNSWLYINV